jgi:putative DNA primase/helicase
VPVWLAFLDRVTRKDDELIAFLQRALGYSLTGLTKEHALFFCYGSGANGKSTLMKIISHALGDYAITAPRGIFEARHNEEHKTEVALLCGARFVSVQETERGSRWAESKVKELTGGDPVSARFMRQDFFTFVPQFKPWISGNHKPSLSSVDEAIRRRLHLIPFLEKIPEEERDKDMDDKLRAEAPGILQWLVEGCLQWQEIGLKPPEIVRAATDEYFADQDVVGNWLAERTFQDPNGFTARDEAWKDFFQYCVTANTKPGDKNSFLDAVGNRVAAVRRKDGRGYRMTLSGGQVQATSADEEVPF